MRKLEKFGFKIRKQFLKVEEKEKFCLKALPGTPEERHQLSLFTRVQSLNDLGPLEKIFKDSDSTPALSTNRTEVDSNPSIGGLVTNLILKNFSCAV